MNFLDMRTVIAISAISEIICVLVAVVLWRQSRRYIDGTGFWVLDFSFQTTGLFLIVLRGMIPDVISIVLANTLAITGALMGYMGLERFANKKGPQWHNYIFIVIFACIHSYFTFVQPDLPARNINLSVALLFICFQCAWLVFYRVSPALQQQMRMVGWIFVGYCLVNVIRIIMTAVIQPADSDLFQSSTLESLFVIMYYVLLISLTYMLVLLFNKRLNLEVHAQEEKFSKAFHSSPYAVTLTRAADGAIFEVNQGFIDITGYQREEIIGKTTIDLHLWANEKDRTEVVAALVNNNRVRDCELQFRAKSGALINGLFSADMIDINGEPCILSSINDITSRKNFERTLQESEEKYRQLFENANEGIGVVQGGTFKLVNRKLTEITGYTSEELLTQPFTGLIHPDDREMVLDRHQRRMRGEVFESTYEFRAINRSGHIIWVEINAVRIDWEGKPATLNFFSDVSLRKQAEQEMANSNSFLNSLIDQSPTPMWISDAGGTLIRINAACCKLLNITEKDVMGKYNILEDNIAEEQGFMPLIKAVFEKGEVARFNLHYSTRQLKTLELDNSAQVALEVTIFPITNAQGRITNAVIQHKDITRQQKAEQSLSESYARLRKTFNDAISTMSKIAEMRDPYTAGHQQRVATLSTAIATEMGLDEERISHISMAAVIHDIGKMYVSADILSKPGRLNDIEMSLIRTHAQGGYDIIKSMDFPSIIAESVLQHHERLDGSGYPRGMKDASISLEARVLAVADVVEAMASHRPYRPALGIERALEEITANSGKLYDPQVVQACLKLFKEKGFKWES